MKNIETFESFRTQLNSDSSLNEKKQEKEEVKDDESTDSPKEEKAEKPEDDESDKKFGHSDALDFLKGYVKRRKLNISDEDAAKLIKIQDLLKAEIKERKRAGKDY